MKIVADKNIPFLKGIVEKYGDVLYLPGNEFTKESIKDADTLIVRTVTYFGEDILEGSKVKLICSATIGYDHIDTEYCEQNNIVWRNAPGCNSGSVMQYIVSALIQLSRKKGFKLQDKTIGIIGVGNVGWKVAKACALLGMKVLLNDPPRQHEEKSNIFVNIDTIKREADIITFHTPLIKEGEYKTHHIADEVFFQSLSKKPFILNSARGGIINTKAIKQALKKGLVAGAVIDCWENEPDIDTEFLEMADIATPHIAGYSADGKENATRMSLEWLASFWKLPEEPIKEIQVPSIENPVIELQKNEIEDTLLRTYNILDDHDAFLHDPVKFSSLRANYPLRREYFAYKIRGGNSESRFVLSNLGFTLE